MGYFLAKTDPAAYSIEDFEREGVTVWDGVRNPQAVGAVRQMRPGDRVFIYHSGGESAVVGLAEVAGEPRPDPRDAKSWVVDLRFLARLEPPTPLAGIKASGRFAGWELVRQPRLSTMPTPEAFVAWMRRRYPKLSL